MTPAKPLEEPDAEQKARDYRWDEYKLIQDKIDKIGDFHFRIRTWAITLVTAIVLGGWAKDIPWYAYLASLAPVLSFNLIDAAQSHWQVALMQRAAQIERALHATKNETSPRVAQILKHATQNLRATRWKWPIRHHAKVFYGTMYALQMFAIACSFCSTKNTTPTSEIEHVSNILGSAPSQPSEPTPPTEPPVADSGTAPSLKAVDGGAQ